jgi:hypothetical protein
MEIRKAVQSGDVEQAIERVNDLDPEILEEQQELFFHLQQQRLIELIRGGQLAEALEFAQEYLAPRGEDHPELLEELGEQLCFSLSVWYSCDDAHARPAGEGRGKRTTPTHTPAPQTH